MRPRCVLLRPGLVDYQDAWQLQRRLAAAVQSGDDPKLVLLQHPPTYTLGVRGATHHLLTSEQAVAARGASVVRTDRGGDVTFHGPGQVVGYPILDLRNFHQGPVWYVRALQDLLIDALSRFGIVAGCTPGRPGVWVGDAKIAAIGVRVSRGVTTHGFALNVTTDLSWFQHIVPCGLPDATVTSMAALTGAKFSLREVEDEVAAAFARRFDLELIDSPAPTVGALDDSPRRHPAAPASAACASPAAPVTGSLHGR